MNTNRTHRLTRGAQRMQWTAQHIAEPLRAAEENADARRAAADLPARVLKVEYRYEWPAGRDVFNVYTDNLSCFTVYTADVGTARDATLRALAGL